MHNLKTNMYGSPHPLIPRVPPPWKDIVVPSGDRWECSHCRRLCGRGCQAQRQWAASLSGDRLVSSIPRALSLTSPHTHAALRCKLLSIIVKALRDLTWFCLCSHCPDPACPRPACLLICLSSPFHGSTMWAFLPPSDSPPPQNVLFSCPPGHALTSGTSPFKDWCFFPPPDFFFK